MEGSRHNETEVSDYIADHIAEWGIRDVFTVTGGGAMHMNDAFWTSSGNCTVLISIMNRHVPWLQRLMHVWIIGWQQSV